MIREEEKRAFEYLKNHYILKNINWRPHQAACCYIGYDEDQSLQFRIDPSFDCYHLSIMYKGSVIYKTGRCVPKSEGGIDSIEECVYKTINDLYSISNSNSSIQKLLSLKEEEILLI